MPDNLEPLLRKLVERHERLGFWEQVKSYLPLVMAVVAMFAFIYTLRNDATNIAVSVEKTNAQLEKIDTRFEKLEAGVQALQIRQAVLQVNTEQCCDKAK